MCVLGVLGFEYCLGLVLGVGCVGCCGAVCGGGWWGVWYVDNLRNKMFLNNDRISVRFKVRLR